jgi:hypothetical protein
MICQHQPFPLKGFYTFYFTFFSKKNQYKIIKIQGNQFCGGFEADEVDIEKHPTGVFSGEGGEKGFRALRVQFSRATFRKAELAAGGSEQFRCSTLDPRRFQERPKLLTRVWFVTVLALCPHRRFSVSLIAGLF